MDFLDSLQMWIKETALYNDFLLHMPAPLNNIYFDTILLAVLLIYCIYRVIDGIQMSKRHKSVKERQLELKEKATENEIHIINHEREARNQREEMNQFMRFMEMSMLAGTTKQLQGIGQQQNKQTFEQFKEQEKQARVEENNQKVHDAFDTITTDSKVVDVHETPTTSVYDIAMAEFTQLENERITAELNALRIENEQMKQDFAKKDEERETAVLRVKQAMAKKEKEKQAEIDKLSKALSDEIANSQKQIDKMVKNLEAYKVGKEKEIAELRKKMSTGSSLERDEKQAEIDRLTAEMNSIKQTQEKAISEKENELALELAKKESQIANLTEEISDIKTKNKTDIDQLTAALKNAHDAQKAAEAEKAIEIEQLTDEINRIQQAKENEIAALKKESIQTISELQRALKSAKAKANELSQASQEREEQIAKLQNMLAETEMSNASEYDTLNQKIATLHKERDAAMADKKAAEMEISTLNNRLNDAQASSKKQIEAKQAEIDKLASAKAAEKSETRPIDRPSTLEEKAISKAVAQTAPVTKSVAAPTSVVKPNFGGNSSDTQAGSDFDKLMAEYEYREAKSQELEFARKSSEEKARTNKEALEQQLVVEATVENSREVHTEDKAKLTAIDEQKRRALEQVRREEAKYKAEEERAKNGNTKKGLSFPFRKK